MSTASQAAQPEQGSIGKFVKDNLALILTIVVLAILPFVIAFFDGLSVADVLANVDGNYKFIQGLLIEIFILAVYAISYDLIFGITGLLSFGHAMFFGVGAYLTGAMLKSFGWGILPTLGLVVVAGVFQALLFGIVLPRVHGITFGLVTLGMSAVFHIVIQSRELGAYTGADVGLQGVVPPEYINPSSERLRFYFLAMAFMFLVYFVYRRFVNSPTGHVCIAIRENEDRAKMMGYNTFYFKLVALILSSITAALAGTLHTLFQPIVSPNVAGLAFTIAALLIILIGGIGTLSGALVGAGIFKLMEFGLDKYFGENASFLIGVVYILLVLFLPYGIIGTWQMKSFQIKQGRQRLLRLFTGGSQET
ncbi:MAG: branched-chain amino acid ABC transporter permease [Anaerolineales bacterium]|jgi:branched-chain amino acid transport system permease protein